MIIDRCLEERPGGPLPQRRRPGRGPAPVPGRRTAAGRARPVAPGGGSGWRAGAPPWWWPWGYACSWAPASWAGPAAVTVRNRRQLALAQHFALEARDLENRLWVERLTPAHDLRPAMARTQEGLDRVRAEMARLGPEAQGPGNLALGRGLLLPGRPEAGPAGAGRRLAGRLPDSGGGLRPVPGRLLRLFPAAGPGRHGRSGRAPGTGPGRAPAGCPRLLRPVPGPGVGIQATWASRAWPTWRATSPARCAMPAPPSTSTPGSTKPSMQEAFSLDAMGVARQKQGQFAAAPLPVPGGQPGRPGGPEHRPQRPVTATCRTWNGASTGLQNPGLSQAERMAQLRRSGTPGRPAAGTAAGQPPRPSAPRPSCWCAGPAFLAERGLDPDTGPEAGRAAPGPGRGAARVPAHGWTSSAGRSRRYGKGGADPASGLAPLLPPWIGRFLRSASRDFRPSIPSAGPSRPVYRMAQDGPAGALITSRFPFCSKGPWPVAARMKPWGPPWR